MAERNFDSERYRRSCVIQQAREAQGERSGREFFLGEIGHQVTQELLDEYVALGKYAAAMRALLQLDGPAEGYLMPGQTDDSHIEDRIKQLGQLYEEHGDIQNAKTLWKRVVAKRRHQYRDYMASSQWSVNEAAGITAETIARLKDCFHSSKRRFLEAAEQYERVLGLLDEKDLIEDLKKDVDAVLADKPIKVRIKKDPRSMSEEVFWQIIELSRVETEGRGEQIDKLTEYLEAFKPKDVVAFQRLLDQKMADAYRNDLWAVAHISLGGCSDDDFEYFCAGLIANGRERYEAALRDPALAAKEVDPDDEMLCEELLYVPGTVYMNMDKGDIRDRVKARMPKLQGARWAEEELQTMYPALCKQFKFKARG